MLPAINLNNLYYKRDESFCINISLAIPEKAFVLLLGHNGAGKSTLISLMGGFLKPQSGSLRLITPPAILFQEHNLFSHLSVWENLRLITKDEKSLEEVLQLFHLKELRKKLVSSLSGGQVQRVALTRLLLQNRAIWIMDEPFSALDIQARGEIFKILYALYKKTGKTFILSTHMIDDFKEFNPHVIFIEKGRVIYQGGLESFLGSKTPIIQNYLNLKKDEGCE